MTLSVTLDVPATAKTPAVSKAVLGATPVAGITCVPDPDGSDGVVIECCTDLDDPASGVDQPQYGLVVNVLNPTFTITDSANPSAAPVIVKMPEMQARRGFRYPWLTSKIKQSNIDLINARQMLRYGNVGAMLQPVNAVKYTGPSDVPGITKYMGAPGDRWELDLVPEWIAIAMMTNDWSQALIIGEGASAFPDIYRDKRTGKPVDKLKYPKMNSYSGGPGYRGGPFLAYSPSQTDSDPNIMYWASNHLPSPFYAIALITLDPYWLRLLQFNANACALNGDSNGTSPMLMAPGEPRDFAWSVREVAMAAVATEEFERRGILPAGCAGSAYFYQIISNVLTHYVMPIITSNADSRIQNFRMLSTDGSFETWELDYVMQVVGWMVLTGKFPGWNQVFLWMLKNAVDRTSGKEWPACIACPYYAYIGKLGDANLPQTWGDLWNVFKQLSPRAGGTVVGAQLGDTLTRQVLDMVNADQFNGGNFPPNMDGYPMGTYAVIATALYLHQLGIIDVLTPYPEITTCFANLNRMIVNREYVASKIFGHGSWFFSNRNAIVFDRSKFTLTPSAFPQKLPAAPVIPPRP